VPEPVVRVVVDGRSFADASSFRGIGSYVRNVVEGLARRPDLDVRVLARPSALLPDGARRRRVLRVAPGRWQAREHDLLLPLDLTRVPGDVAFSPALDPPAVCHRPWVQTLHDVLPLDGRSPEEVRRFRQQATRYRRAAALVAVSRWTADEAINRLELDPARVHVVPHGVSARFRPGPGPDGPPYLLFVGEYDPRKRHALAYAAVGALADKGFPHELVVTGRLAPWYADEMAALHAGAPRPDRVVVRGHVSADELLALYQGASALVVTSSAEGFGFPALEAMACGTPVVAFANSAITEVVGDAGVLVEDGDVGALVDALVSVLSSPERRADLSGRAQERAGRYTWEASVEQHAAILRSVTR
jgi:glycosyltransferase involved in cell wall biosynthesis